MIAEQATQEKITYILICTPEIIMQQFLMLQKQSRRHVKTTVIMYVEYVDKHTHNYTVLIYVAFIIQIHLKTIHTLLF